MSESNKMSKIGEWFKNLRAEFKKIIWPDQSSVIRQTITVAIITVILGAIIVVADQVVLTLIGKIIGKSL